MQIGKGLVVSCKMNYYSVATYGRRLQDSINRCRILGIRNVHAVRYHSGGKTGRTLYSLFPNSLPEGPPPNGPFEINIRELRSEFLKLQAKTHPDLAPKEEDKERFELESSKLNKAYSTLRDPLHRALYLLELNGMEISEDEGRKMPQDPELLMMVYEMLEEIEEAGSEEDIEGTKERLDGLINYAEESITKAFDTHDLETAKQATIELKYWTNIRESLKEWEPGKPIRMVH
ncbi:hypothetical protein V1511DRAFT_506352 [Dipodascopsis uninucleata]